jgi:hypothetical protein
VDPGQMPKNGIFRDDTFVGEAIEQMCHPGKHGALFAECLSGIHAKIHFYLPNWTGDCHRGSRTNAKKRHFPG